MIVGFLKVWYAVLRMLEVYYKIFDKFCHVDSIKELEIDTDSLYLALAHDKFYDCIQPSKKAVWEALRQHDCDGSFKADAVQIFFPRTCCDE